MSANISSLFVVGERAWHGLGTVVEKALTAEEAIKASGLDWTVSKRPLTYPHYEVKDGATFQTFKEVPDQYAVVRDDNQVSLGVVGGRFHPLQNKQAFSFFDAVVGIKEAVYHTAGALGNGERVWLLAKLNGLIRVTGDDVVEKYLLLANGHDGLTAVNMLFTPIRVVCQNTLNQALNTDAVKFWAKHTVNLGSKVEEVRAKLGIINNQFLTFEEGAKRLAATQVTQEALNNYFRATLAPEAKPGEEISTRTKNVLEEVSKLFETGKGQDLPGVKGSVWAAYNAVTEYVDFHRGKEETRTNSILFGSGSVIKGRAWDEALNTATILA